MDDIVPHAQVRGMENGNRISILQLGNSSFYLCIRMGDIVSYTKALEIENDNMRTGLACCLGNFFLSYCIQMDDVITVSAIKF